MPSDPAIATTPTYGAADWAIRKVLVVDDSRAQRRVLTVTLTRLGFDVYEAETGDEALEMVRKEPIDLILSDWMMPGMDGLELCRKVRALDRETYAYFILLTSKSEKGAVAQGLDIGADDFLTKPVNREELRARIAAGDRIIAMERELNEKNRLVSETLNEISTLYDALDRDLVEARKMQLALVRERFRDFGDSEVSLLLKPSGHVGGDLVGMFDAGGTCFGVYSIDVSGHGIASALLTARLAALFPDDAPPQNIALESVVDWFFRARTPSAVAHEMNTLMHSELKSDLYFTMTLAIINQRTGAVDFTQCGHPNLAVINSEGTVRYLGDGGLPIGLIEDALFETQSFTLEPGDRLVLYSDGFTECTNADGAELEEAGFAPMLAKNNDLSPCEFVEALTWDLDDFAGGAAFSDDLSCVAVDYRRNKDA